ncbi:MAG: DNA glycosylase AlkZ-like family protein [Candidatus Limnocylindria bacterium]
MTAARGEPRPLTIQTARRLAIAAQRLAGPSPSVREPILDTVRAIGRLQLDPTPIVARTHLLVLWSRLGRYDVTDLDRLLWRERRLWEHDAFIYPVEDYPLRLAYMRRFPDTSTARGRLIRDWLAANRVFADAVVKQLERDGPTISSGFEDRSVQRWASSGWNDNRNISRMLELLGAQGRVVVGGRRGNERVWDLPDRFLPPDVPREPMDLRQAAQIRTERLVRSLGVASRRELLIARRGLQDDPLDALQADGRLVPVDVAGWPGERYLHVEDLAALEAIEAGAWSGRTTLLSPFDNLIVGRERVAELFGFAYTMELYVPAAKRRFGYWVMPVLQDDALIGRLDLAVDRSRRVLVAKAVHAEPGARTGARAARAIGSALAHLAAFAGADSVELVGPVPDGWSALAG